MRRSLSLVVSLAVGGLVLVACGSDSTGPGGSTAGAGGTAHRPPAQELRSGAPNAKAPPELTLAGTVDAGVEKGCLVLVSNGTAYVLLGELTGVLPGSEVTVRGHEATDARTTCQQGAPFQVTAVLTATVGADPAT